MILNPHKRTLRQNWQTFPLKLNSPVEKSVKLHPPRSDQTVPATSAAFLKLIRSARMNAQLPGTPKTTRASAKDR